MECQEWHRNASLLVLLNIKCPPPHKVDVKQSIGYRLGFDSHVEIPQSEKHLSEASWFDRLLGAISHPLEGKGVDIFAEAGLVSTGVQNTKAAKITLNKVHMEDDTWDTWLLLIVDFENWM